MRHWKKKISGLCVLMAAVWGLLGCSSRAYYRPVRKTVRSYRAPSPGGARRKSMADGYARRSRPGLGTAYGRSVYSRVRFTQFRRASSQPYASLQMYYNDPRGVYAMARSLGGHICCRPVAVQHAGAVSMRLVSEGRTLRGIRTGGRTIVMGRHGSRYAIYVRNHSRRRFEIVASVDGLDVIDGRRARLGKRGYILSPYGSLTIRGFRRSRTQVASFRFSSVRRSYASRTGQGRNVGVIGLAVFAEQLPTWRRSDVHRRLNATPFSTPPSHMAR